MSGRAAHDYSFVVHSLWKQRVRVRLFRVHAVYDGLPLTVQIIMNVCLKLHRTNTVVK